MGAGVRRLVSAALAALALLFLSFFSSSAAVSLPRLGLGLEHGREEGYPGRVILGQKRFTGPGSSPPTCRSKCGRCEPCKPVHVPIQPGLSTPLEYYPEAWRCKCVKSLCFV
ncbi:PREDICTED: EPIDERMAL PATTERNING FACTOR-like protein 4 [Tarenaya hassleriana]|uniref:EPIDERMAL PATTERNING FACTOR-like protein 4 n=1 Tax=Tarenaya hassleriana TaxID=28532 RepID=UPI00053C248A|nr:PREDICTED: EPIDERMAL PATTERNING FACTOR-like protein 4 [Tarenaya hassleriana]